MSGSATEKVVTRFVPSPTGALHVGGARTALYAWAFARGHGGRFILRFEDTDQARSRRQSEQPILDDLRWLGLDWDEGPDVGGPNGPYHQSKRLDIYNQQIDKLLAAGLAYEHEDAVRLRVDQDVVFDDVVYGRIEVKADQIEDFVIRKGEARQFFPTFHLAVVVDDALMGVTHVIRGQEHLSNTPKHVALQDALGFGRPIYAHTPTILNPDGSKMSKRDKARVARRAARDWMSDTELTVQNLEEKVGLPWTTLAGFLDGKNDDEPTAAMIADRLDVDLPEIDVIDFRMRGYLPEVICNYVSLLGWSPGNNIEQFDRKYLMMRFGLDRIGKSNARFDRQKLQAFNADAIATMSTKEYEQRLREHLQMHHIDMLRQLDNRIHTFAACYQARSHTLEEPVRLGAFFFVDDDAIEYDDKAVSKVLLKGDALVVLRDLEGELADCEDWSASAIEQTIKAFAETRGLGMGKVAQPLRVAVSGGTVSPPIGDTLAILGKESTLARVRNCIGRFRPTPDTQHPKPV